MVAGEKIFVDGTESPARVDSRVTDLRRAVSSRTIGAAGIFFFAVNGIGLAYYGLFPVSTIAGLYPGSNLLWTVGSVALISLLFAYLYSVISAVMPHHGADYLLASRVVSRPLAFAASWTAVLLTAAAAGAIVASIFQTILPIFLQILVRVAGYQQLSGVEAWLQAPSAISMLGTLFIFGIFLLLMLPTQSTRRFLQVGAFLTLLAWGILCWQLSTHQTDDFAAGYDRVFGALGFIHSLVDARGLGMLVDARPVTAIFGGLLMALWMGFGFQTGSGFAGEVKESGRSQWIGTSLAILASFGVFALALFWLERAVPAQWMAAQSFLYLHSQTVEGLPWLPLYGALLVPSPGLIFLVGAAWIYGILTLVLVVLYSASRVVVAWGLDGVFPVQAADEHRSLRTQLIAVLFVCIAAEFGIVAAAADPAVLLRFKPVLFLFAVMLPPLLAVTILPFRQPARFASAPAFARWHIGRIPGITLLGSLAICYIVAMLAANIRFEIFGSVESAVLILVGLIFAAGLALYYLSRAGVHEQGQALEARLREFPQ